MEPYVLLLIMLQRLLNIQLIIYIPFPSWYILHYFSNRTFDSSLEKLFSNFIATFSSLTGIRFVCQVHSLCVKNSDKNRYWRQCTRGPKARRMTETGRELENVKVVVITTGAWRKARSTGLTVWLKGKGASLLKSYEREELSKRSVCLLRNCNRILVSAGASKQKKRKERALLEACSRRWNDAKMYRRGGADG